MSDIPEAIGTAAEGGLFARAISPKDGEAEQKPGKGHFDEDTCLNCGAELTGPYCSNCGQKAHLHRTMGAFMHDLFYSALHFDGKIWRTLPMLVRRPGELTRRYIDGERARYISPLALFLFAVFLMFAVFQAVGLTAPGDLSADQGSITAEMDEDRAELVAEKETLQARLAELEGPEATALEEELAGVEESIAAIDTGKAVVMGDSLGDAGTRMTVNSTSELPFFQNLAKKWRENPSLMLYKLQANFYKFSWLLVPLSMPFVWLLFFWRREFKAYDHAIFITYSLAFMSLLFIAVSLLTLIPALGAIGGLLMIFIPPAHIYKQLRGTYGLGRRSAFVRTLLLLFFIIFVVAIFLQILLLLGAF